MIVVFFYLILDKKSEMQTFRKQIEMDNVLSA